MKSTYTTLLKRTPCDVVLEKEVIIPSKNLNLKHLKVHNSMYFFVNLMPKITQVFYFMHNLFGYTKNEDTGLWHLPMYTLHLKDDNTCSCNSRCTLTVLMFHH